MRESWKAGGSPPAARKSIFALRYGETDGIERSHSVVSFSGSPSCAARPSASPNAARVTPKRRLFTSFMAEP